MNTDMNERLTRKKEEIAKLRSQLSKTGLDALEKRLQLGLKERVIAECIPPRGVKSPVCLSFPQQGMWIVDQFQPGVAAYNVPTSVRMKGSLDVHALKQSLDELIRRHESLRTSFAKIEGEPFQIVTDRVDLNLPVDDLSALPEEPRQTDAKAIVKEQNHRPFDLTQAPLFRARLIKLAANDHVLIIVLHHIISDVWSMGVIFRELSALYNAYSKNESSPLRELPIQYPDFAVWQRNHLQGEVFDEHLNYWKRQLSGAPATLELPADYPRPARLSARGAVEKFTLPEWLSEKVKQLSVQQGATLFMTLLTAFKLLLSRYSNQRDIVVGCATAGRNRAELEGLIGVFVNTLAMRTEFSDDPTFIELLKRVKEVCLGAFAHQELPFDRIVSELQPERSSNHSPIFQVMFALHSTHQQLDQQRANWNGLDVSGFSGKAETSMFDMSFRVIETPQTLAGTIEYSTDLFDAETIKRMARHFRVLLASIVSRPENRISSLPILSEDEASELLHDWNDIRRVRPHELCIHDLFEQQAEKTPDAIALTSEDDDLNYRELNSRANQLAHYLKTLGVGPETLVGICVERSIEMVVGILGILKAGGAYLPLDPEYPQDRLNFMLADAAVPVLLTQERLLESLPPHSAHVVCLDADWPQISQESASNLTSTVIAENLAYVIYTSGSTGRPKGVMVTHGNVVRLFSATAEWFNFGAGDVWTLFHSYAFDFSVWEIWGALLYGGRLVVVPYLVSRSPHAFYDLLRERNVTVLNQTPSAFRQLIQAEQGIEDARSLALRLVIFGGEALEPQSLKAWFQRHGDQRPQLVNMYGITETTVHVTYRPILETDNPRSMIGVRIPDLQVFVLDQQLQCVPVGIAGEIYVGGDGLARGYLQRPGLTAQRFIPNPFSADPGVRLYRTGDLARFRADGDLEYIGRADHQVKVRGFRIELGEIEAALARHPYIKDAAVIAREDSPGDKRLVAYVIPTASDPDIGAVRSFLGTCLPDYMVPAAFVTLDSFPLDPSGKLDRKALPAPDNTRATLSTDFVAPRTSLEQDIADIWTALLGVKRIGIHDNFFELGGHSLLLTQLATRLRDTFGVEVPMRILFDVPTVEGISLSITSQLMESNDADLEALLAEMAEMTPEETFAR